LYDYRGFPEEAYQYTIPNQGDPELAKRISMLIKNRQIPGIDVKLEKRRGYDHGVFVPLLLARVRGSVPVLQVSLVNATDTDTHLMMGEALAPLRKEGVLLVGSGMTYHNLKYFFQFDKSKAIEHATDFNANLNALIECNRIEKWHEHHFAKMCHPTAEHFFPLLVIAGSNRVKKGKV
jgi:aromatic ring-opening dioxygenase catalytic subunit (LigB family)